MKKIKTTFFLFVTSPQTHAFFIAFFCTFLLFPITLNLEIYAYSGSLLATDTLDPSYRLAISKANVDHLIWGREFVLTYGPLSYLPLKLGWGINEYQFLIFDLFISLNFFCIYFLEYIKADRKLPVLILIVSTTFFLPTAFGPGYSLVLLAFLIYWIGRSFDDKNLFFDFMQLNIVILMFYIKFNSGLIGLVFFTVGLLYRFLFQRESKLSIAGFFLVSIFSIFLCGYLLKVDIPRYMITGFELVGGYNEVMYSGYNFSAEVIFSIAFCFSTFLVLLVKFIYADADRIKNLVRGILFFTSIYVLYKQAFVRADSQHTPVFFTYFLLFVLCTREFHCGNQLKIRWIVIVGIICSCYFFLRNVDDQFGKAYVRTDKSLYAKSFKQYTDTSALFLFPNNNHLPKKIGDRIASAYTDIYPWNLHLLVENRLNYRPRPIAQSYYAYRPQLEFLNTEHYNSRQAPEFVFYEYLSIDNRYPLFDESLLNLTLLKNYTCVDTFGFAQRPMLLLERNKEFKKVTFKKTREFDINMDDVLLPQRDHYYKLFVQTTLKGRLVSLASHAPEIQLEIKTKDGNSFYYRTSKGLLETGVFSNYLIRNTNDFYKYIGGNHSGEPDHKIVSYRIVPNSPDLYQQAIKVIEYEIGQ
jgi:hypothetical protein